MFRTSLRYMLRGSNGLPQHHCLLAGRLSTLSIRSSGVRGASWREYGSRCSIGAATPNAALTLAARHGGSNARTPSWRRAGSGKSWRRSKAQVPPKAKSAPPCQNAKIGMPKARSPRRSSSTARKKNSSAQSRRRRQPRKLSPHQRQTEKYNKRVVAIARLWKAQRQGVQKRKAPLASRLA